MTKFERVIKETNGKFFTARFWKDNGELRRMTCRTGVKKGVSGVPLDFYTSKKGHKNVVVWDTAKQDFRTIPLRRLLSVTFKGIEHNILGV
tara:strand:- start:459 stop:731 length:273 start_codon:yes stop_codon:yes gene_type:complete